MTEIELLASQTHVKSKSSRRPLFKIVMHVLRRGHLYFGLLLFPWAILYGVTAFLFNHPSAFSDSANTTFGSDVVVGTSMESPGTPTEVAQLIVANLNERAKDGASYTLLTHIPPSYNRDLSFALVKTDDGQTINVGLDAVGNGGTVRGQPPKTEPKAVEKAPFAIGTSASGGRGQRGGGNRPTPAPRANRSPVEDFLKLNDPLHERVKAAVPTVLKRTGFPVGEITVTSVPDLIFHLSDQAGKSWKVTANVMAGTVSGVPADVEKEPNELSIRRFLLRLHTTHGYPSIGGIRWWWAVIVDVMAFVMVFWGLSGLLMWWQLKATRKFGVVLVILSLIAAAYLSLGMHTALTGG